MDWVHLPFADTTAPDEDWMIQFEQTKGQLQDSIKEGGKVVVHCKGGLGRAGTFAALLLLCLGLPASMATSMVRKTTRVDCINPSQEEFLLSL